MGMFEPTSRYHHLENATLTTEDGRAIVYKKRRFLPQGVKMPTLREIVVNAGDRLDLIAARTLGDPEQFWRICDANNAMYPPELTREPNRILRISVPGR